MNNIVSQTRRHVRVILLTSVMRDMRGIKRIENGNVSTVNLNVGRV